MEQQPKGISEEMMQAIQTAGNFYGYATPDEDLKRRRPVQDFKAGAEWLYRFLAPQMEAMREIIFEFNKILDVQWNSGACHSLPEKRVKELNAIQKRSAEILDQ